jgi:protein-tyrosine-phosphatase
MNPENPYHKEALVAGLAKAVDDFNVVSAEHGFPATDENRTAFCVEILAEWGIETKHMASIIDAAVAKAGDAQ